MMMVTIIAGHLKRFGGLYLLVITYVSDYMNAPTHPAAHGAMSRLMQLHEAAH
jgi:hypothetical protein